MTQIKNEINSIDEEICDLRESLQNQLTTGQSPIINITAGQHMENRKRSATFSQVLQDCNGNVALYANMTQSSAEN